MYARALVVAQLVERSLPIPKVRGSVQTQSLAKFILNISAVLKRRK